MLDLFAHDQARDDQLILVDGLDRPCGTASKMKAHRAGLLHRAFSVVLVRQGSTCPELLLSQRAEGKYHSAGLWANSCCSHPRVGEQVVEAAYRRVREELGLQAQGLEEIGAFAYRAVFENGLTEYEYDHVLVGACTGELCPDPTEIADTRWVAQDVLAQELADRPQAFAAWAYMVLSLALAHLCPGAGPV